MIAPSEVPVWISGTLVTSTATFTNEQTGAVADPTTITIKYNTVAGTVTTVVYPAAGITRVSEGVYQAAIDTTGWAGPGDLFQQVQWTGTGAVQAIEDGAWFVSPPAL